MSLCSIFGTAILSAFISISRAREIKKVLLSIPTNFRRVVPRTREKLLVKGFLRAYLQTWLRFSVFLSLAESLRLYKGRLRYLRQPTRYHVLTTY